MKPEPKIGDYVICFEERQLYQPQMDRFLLSTIGQITDIHPWEFALGQIVPGVFLYRVKLERTIEDPQLKDRVPIDFFIREIKYFSPDRNTLIPFIDANVFGI